jgi:hypothetical protein
MKKYILIVVIFGSFAFSLPAYAGKFCAIAFSDSTCNYGFSFGAYSEREADRIALRGCNAGDAKIVGWCEDGYVALARGDGNSWGCAFGANLEAVKRKALYNCQSYHKHIEKWVYSGT